MPMRSRSPIATVAQGALRGRAEDGVHVFRGVPYAAPPVGRRRFAVPEPAEPWSGVRDAVDSGPTPPQRVGRFPQVDLTPVIGPGWIQGDDYLTLNVWAPADADGAPVMVYVPGGGLVIGSKDATVYSGRGFARSGAVCVALNYRLGIDGFLPIEGAPTNLGLRDMLAALAWVRDNVGAFGGDADNLTLFGESGGAMAVADLVTSPLAKGLLTRAVVQSGHGSSVYSRDVAQRTVDRLARLLGVAPDVEGFRATTFDAGLAAVAKINRPNALDLRDDEGFDSLIGLNRFNPVLGDDVLPVHPLQALRNGAGRDVDLLIGTTSEEANSWLVPTRIRPLLPGWVGRRLVGRVMPRASEAYDAYRSPGRRGGDVFGALLTDLAFRGPAREYAAAHTGRTHVYEFDWQSPACGGKLGACHGLDLAFVFDTLATVSGPRGLAGTDPPQALAHRIHATWCRFAAHGSLDWDTFDPQTRAVQRLAAGHAVHEDELPIRPYLQWRA